MSTPTLTEIINESIEAELEQIHTCLPGKVVLYNPATSSANIQPCMLKSFADNPVPLPYPIINGCPVVLPRSARGGVSTDLLVGDYGLLIFSERNIDNWALSGLDIVPADSTKFALNDAFFIPGAVPQIIPDTAGATRPLTTSLFRTDAGFVNMFNAVESLSVLMQDLLTAVSGIATFGSPASHVGTPTWIAQITAIQLRFAALLGVI